MQNTTKPLLRINNLKKTYKIGEFTINAVDGITLSINKGDFISFMGPSGSGKTTLLNLIGCIDKPTEGSIFLEEKEISTLSEKELDLLRLNKIGFVFQRINLIPVLSAIENVILPMELANNLKTKEMLEKGKELLALVGLSHRINHRPAQLSAGEQQRVGIARALANNPTLILADEPTGNLDSKTTMEVIDLFTKINENSHTIILVTHNLEVAKASKKILTMKDGKIN